VDQTSTAIGLAHGDPFARPLLFVRIICGVLALMPLLLCGVMWLLGFGLPLHDYDGPVLLVTFAFLALVPLVAAPFVPVIGVRLSAEPVSLALWNGIMFALGMQAALLGFVASIIYSSASPFLVGLTVTGCWFVFAWPRGRRWHRWVERYGHCEPDGAGDSALT